jgi:hypothetical protein
VTLRGCPHECRSPGLHKQKQQLSEGLWTVRNKLAVSTLSCTSMAATASSSTSRISVSPCIAASISAVICVYEITKNNLQLSITYPKVNTRAYLRVLVIDVRSSGN